MHLRKLATGAGAAVALIASGLISPPAASAAPDFNSWVTSQYAQIVDDTTLSISLPGDYWSAYAYNNLINLPVKSGDVISYRLDTSRGAYCTYYYPQVYVTVDGRGFSSYNDGTNCPGNSSYTQDDGRVSFTVTEDGVMDYIQLTYYDEDENGSGGAVTFSDLRLNDSPILFHETIVQPPAEPTPTATVYGADLSKARKCRMRTYAFLDAALEGQVASPSSRTFITRMDGEVKRRMTIQAGEEGGNRFRMPAKSGKHTITVKTRNGQLLDRMRVGTRRC